MKKRILASTMASVMALSAAGTSLVSFADIDASFKDVQSVTKAELRKFMETTRIKTLGDNECEDYGEIAGERFMKAYKYAESVLDTEYDTVEETDAAATSAFQLLKQAESLLKNYTAKELAGLVETHRGTYNTENKLNPNNEENEDKVYGEEDWDEFSSAFEDADSLTTSSDKRDITDAYENLVKAADGLTKLQTKTKGELTKAWRKYSEAIRDTEFNYQPWQRGIIKASGTDYNNREAAWGAVFAHCKSGYAQLEAQYNAFNAEKLSKTSNPNIVAAINAMDMAANVLTGFTANALNSGTTLKKVQNMIADYQGRLVADYKADTAMEVYNSFVNVVSALTAGDGNRPQSLVNNKWENAAVVDASTALDDYWNITKSAEADYKALNQKKTAQTYRKVLESELEVSHNSSKVVYYKLDKTTTMFNGEHSIKALTTGVYFTTTKPSIDSSTEILGEIKKGTRNSFNISEHIDFDADDIKVLGLKETTAYTNAAADKATAVASKTDAINALCKSAVTGTPAGALKAIADELGAAAALSTYTFAGDSKKGTEYQAAIREYAEAADDYKAFIDAAIENKATLSSDDILALFPTTGTTDVKTAYDAYKAKQAAIATAKTNATAANGNVAGDSAGTITNEPTSTLTTAITALTSGDLTDLTTAEGAIDTAQTAMDAALDPSNLDSSTPKEDNSKYNNVLDKTSEITVSDWSGKKGLCRVDTDNGIDWSFLGFDFSDYDSLATKNDCTDTVVNMADAFELLTVLRADDAIANGTAGHSWDDDGEVDRLDNTNSLDITDKSDEKKPVSTAYRLVLTYLQYALADKYDAAADDIYTKGDVKKLIDDSYDLAELAIDTDMFRFSHNELVDARKDANEWWTAAEREKIKDKDYETLVDGQNSTTTYKDLKSKYDQLKKEYEAFKYSYGDVVKMMYDAAKVAEATTDKTKAKAVTDALGKVSEAFLNIEILKKADETEYSDYQIFDDDGVLDTYARILSNTDGVEFKTGASSSDKFKADKSSGDNKNKSHRIMMEAIKALDDAVTGATTQPEDPKKPSADADGDGTVTMAEVRAVIQLYSDTDADKREVAKFDFDGDGKVDMKDLTKLVQDYVDKKL